MRLAAEIGLDVAPVQPRVVRDRTFLLVERYDRAVGTMDRCVVSIRRISARRSECRRRPNTPARAARPSRIASNSCAASPRPAVDVLKLLDAVIFNVIAGNADAHGKNFSILYSDEGPRLAPLYDLLATVAYPELSPKFAMKIGKRSTLAELDARGWGAFAADAGLGLPLIRRRVAEISKGVLEKATTVAAELSRPELDALRR
jgi:serine/threonine-protein kinase HipA